MGFLQNIRLASKYENRLKLFGINPREIPPDVHSKLCTLCDREAAEVSNTLRMSSDQRSEHLEQSILDLADTVALCIAGSANFKRVTGYSHSEVIDDLVQYWVNSGPESTTRLQAIHAINNLRMLNKDFAEEFISHRINEEKRRAGH